MELLIDLGNIIWCHIFTTIEFVMIVLKIKI